MSKMTKLINYQFELPTNGQDIISELTRQFVKAHTSSIVNRIADHKMHCDEEGIEFTEADSVDLFFKCVNSMAKQTRLNYEIVYDEIVDSIKRLFSGDYISASICDSLQDRFTGIEIIKFTSNSIKFSIDTDYVDESEEVMLFLDSVFDDFRNITKDLTKGIDLEPIDFLKDTELEYVGYLELSLLNTLLQINLIYSVQDINK